MIIITTININTHIKREKSDSVGLLGLVCIIHIQFTASLRINSGRLRGKPGADCNTLTQVIEDLIQWSGIHKCSSGPVILPVHRTLYPSSTAARAQKLFDSANKTTRDVLRSCGRHQTTLLNRLFPNHMKRWVAPYCVGKMQLHHLWVHNLGVGEGPNESGG